MIIQRRNPGSALPESAQLALWVRNPFVSDIQSYELKETLSSAQKNAFQAILSTSETPGTRTEKILQNWTSGFQIKATLSLDAMLHVRCVDAQHMCKRLFASAFKGKLEKRCKNQETAFAKKMQQGSSRPSCTVLPWIERVMFRRSQNSVQIYLHFIQL